jgi:hypothetical protein
MYERYTEARDGLVAHTTSILDEDVVFMLAPGSALITFVQECLTYVKVTHAALRMQRHTCTLPRLVSCVMPGIA